MKRFTHKYFNMLHLLIVIGFITAVAQARIIDRTVVAVNDEVVLESDLTSFMKKSKSKSFQELYGGIDPTMLKNREGVLAFLIDEKIIDQQVKKLELEASEQEVDGQIRSIVERNGITERQLKSRLAQLGTTMAQYRAGIKRQVERRHLLEREIKPNLQISDEQLKYFYKRHARQNKADAVYSIAHIFIDPSKNTKVPAKQRAAEIWKEVSKNPDQFDQFVKTYSDDGSSAETGGALGDFSLSSLVGEFKRVVPNTAIGSVTAPIKTSSGYHIVKVLDKKTSGFDALDPSQKAELRNQMASVEIERKMQIWLQRKKLESHVRRFDQPTKGTP